MSFRDPVTTTGHADFVETADGKWYAVFPGCRPYEGDHYNIGRETFMAPVEWKDGWPHILEGNAEVQYQYPVPQPALTKKIYTNLNGNFSFADEFDKPKLNHRWEFLRTPEGGWYSLAAKKGSLEMDLVPQTCSGKDNPAFIGFRQQHIKGYAGISLNFNASAQNEKAGLLVFQNEAHFYFLCRSVSNGRPVVQLYQSAKDSMVLMAGSDISDGAKELQLKIESQGKYYAFYYALQDGPWTLLKDGMDAKFLSTKTAGGFVGSMYALYATSLGEKSSKKAYFNRFETRADDELYK